MEDQSPKTGKFALNYGILLGAINVVFSLMLHFMDMQYDQGQAKNIISIFVLLAILVIAIYQFKKTNNGFLKLSEALKVGMGAALIAGIIVVLYLLIYFNFIDPGFVDKFSEISRAAMMENNPEMTTEQIENAITMQKDFFWITYPTILIFNLFVGFIVSLITGLAMKKSESEY